MANQNVVISVLLGIMEMILDEKVVGEMTPHAGTNHPSQMFHLLVSSC
jgi:hypothetical protein